MYQCSTFISCFAKIIIRFGWTDLLVSELDCCRLFSSKLLWQRDTFWRRPFYLYAVQTLRVVHKWLITLYTKEHTKSMKPHCILGSCSAQFLSIMGWKERKIGERKAAERRNEITNNQNISFKREMIRLLRLAVGPKQFSPSLLAPRILLPPSGPPVDERNYLLFPSLSGLNNRTRYIF